MKKIIAGLLALGSLSVCANSVECLTEKASEMTSKVNVAWLDTKTPNGRQLALSLASILCSGKKPASVECLTEKASEMTNKVNVAWLETKTQEGRQQALSLAANLCVNH